MLEEAEKYAAIDKEQKENTELIVSATMYCDQLEKTLNENTNEMNWIVEEKKEISSLIANLREAISLQKYDSIKQYVEQVKNFLSTERT